MAYTLPSWVDSPATASPLSAANLILFNNAINDLDARGTAVATNAQTGTTYTLVLGDAGKVVEMNNAAANTLTVPPNSSVAFPVGTVLEVCQTGVGQTTIAAGSGVTFRPSGTLAARTQWSTVGLRKRATDEWVISGDLA